MLNKIINSIIITFVICFNANPVIASNNVVNALIPIQVRGAVNKPGIYKIPSGSRLIDVIYKAGGLRKDAVLNNINMTTPVTDGTSVYIASKADEVKKIEEKKDNNIKTEKVIDTSKNTKPVVEKKVIQKPKKSKEITSYKKENNVSKKHNPKEVINLNLATEEELNELPGIGDTLARNIVSYRVKNGKFKSLDELNNVDGIGKKKLKKLKNKLTI